MVTRSPRLVLSGLAACAAIAIVTATALPAAASSNSGSGGGTYVGETLVATAWETTLSTFTVSDGIELHAEHTDLYSYRIGLDTGAMVDFQSTEGFEGLTQAEQEQWYVDAGLAPYEFDWFVFYCPTVRVGTVAPAILEDTGINLLDVPYRTVAGQTGFPAFSGSELNDWYMSVVDGSAFSPQLANAFDIRFRTLTDTAMLDSSENYNGTRSVLATSYLNFTCPDGFGPELGRVLTSSTPTDYAVDRSLTVGSTLFIEPQYGPVALPDVLEIRAAGTYIGVTGQYIPANAALWGVTYVNAGVRALPDTGVNASVVWSSVAGAALLVLAGLALVVVRRKAAR